MTVIAQDDHLTAGAWATCVWIYLLQRPGGGGGGGGGQRHQHNISLVVQLES